MKHKTNGTKTEERASVEAGVIIKLGLDVHARQVTVVRQMGDQAPQPAQKFTEVGLAIGPVAAGLSAGQKAGGPDGPVGPAKKEAGDGGRPAAGHRPVAAVYRPDHRREDRPGADLRSLKNPFPAANLRGCDLTGTAHVRPVAWVPNARSVDCTARSRLPLCINHNVRSACGRTPHRTDSSLNRGLFSPPRFETRNVFLTQVTSPHLRNLCKLKEPFMKT